ncbi:MAG: type II toxin-antitoxin system VapC family toxin [Patescibacteria group bacterium]
MDENIDSKQLLVVDASVILAAIFPQEAYKRHAMMFIDQSMRSAKKFIAPSILLYEIFNAVRSAILSKRITGEEAQTILSAYKTIEPTYVDFSILSESALKIALESNTSIYDAAYAALAYAREYSMCTLDKKLIQKLKVLPVNVVYLGDFG